MSTVQHVEVPNRLRAVKKRIPKPLKRLARSAVRSYGVRTSAHRVLPDFLVIGTKRGGTTSVWNWLVRHPHVAPMFPSTQQIKSPHYFDINFVRGLSWYRSHFPTRAALARHEQRTGFRPLTGEASPYYMFHPQVCERVAAVMADVKLIVTLRNPVDRAYSNYWERRGSNAEELPTFEEAIDAEEHRLDGEVERILADPGYYSPDHDCHSYLARGRYLEHLRPWLDMFDAKQLLILPFEQITRDAAATHTRIQEFLGLPVVEVPELPHHNKLPVPPMDPATRTRLVEYYRPHNAALSDTLDTPFNWDR
jgi:hypothetical protein